MSIGTYKKPKWGQIARWKGLTPDAKLVALILRSRAGKDGWANVSPGEIAEQAGFPDNRRVNAALKELETAGTLEQGESELQYRRVYRLHNSSNVF
jgi:alkylated DNA nucleotide flippase Atl1